MKNIKVIMTFLIIILFFGFVLQTINLFLNMNIINNVKIIYDSVNTLGLIIIGVLFGIMNQKIIIKSNKYNVFIIIFLISIPLLLIYIDLGFRYPNTTIVSNFVSYYIFESNSIFYKVWCIVTGYYCSIFFIGKYIK